MKDRFRCVTTDLPGFSGDDAHAEKWGYSTEEVVKRIESTVERVGNGQPVILIAHDFGCMYSFKFEAKRPDLVRKFVAIDVGGAMKPSVCGAMMMVTYQVGGGCRRPVGSMTGVGRSTRKLPTIDARAHRGSAPRQQAARTRSIAIACTYDA